MFVLDKIAMTADTSEQLPIRTIVALTGVNAITLRAWERRYGLIRPLRTPKGHRLYSHQHVETIRRALALVERGIPIGQVREALSDAQTSGAAKTADRWQPYIEGMLAAITLFDEPDLDRVYDEALSIHPVDEVTRRVVVPLLARLGERWRDIAGGIAEEHFFATYLRSKLGARLQHRMRYASGPRLVTACAPGEQHEVGLLLLSLEAQAAGMRTIVLGADTPLAEVEHGSRRAKADAIVISSSVDPAPGLIDRDLARLVRNAGVPVFVGGSTSVRERRAVSAAGAIPLGTDIEHGVRFIATHLETKGVRT